MLAQYDTPDQILASPASPFVEHFVGADRGLKRLSLARVRDLPLVQPQLVAVGDSFAAARQRLADGTAWALVLDADRHPVGWLETRALQGEGSISAQLAVPGSALLQPESTLRDALVGDARLVGPGGRRGRRA